MHSDRSLSVRRLLNAALRLLLSSNGLVDALSASSQPPALQHEASNKDLGVSDSAMAVALANWRFRKMEENGYFNVLPSYPGHHVHRTESDDGTVSAMTWDPGQSLPAGQMEYGGHQLVADDEWVQVMRFGTKCRAVVEGYCNGFKNDCGEDYLQLNRSDLVSCTNAAKTGYGCWFFFAEAKLEHTLSKRHFGKDLETTRSSGVAVNVGKSLRVDSRYSASHALGVPCADPPLCVSRAHAQDKLWCEQAVKMGYDSIQIARPHLPCLEDRCLMSPPGWLTELAICKGRCMTEAVYDACPPGIELRTAKGEQCNCPSGAPLLNCGANSTLYERPDHGTQVMSALKCIEQ